MEQVSAEAVKSAPVPHPGEILAGMLVDRRLSPDSAAFLCGLHPDALAGMVSGTGREDGGVLVTEHIDAGLARGLGTEPGFWLEAQRAYYESLAEEAKAATGGARA